jgi:hypothetical protein
MSTFDLGSAGITAVNTILTEEANRIGQDIYTRTLHTSPWMDLMKQSAFPDGMGYTLTTLVYDRVIPRTTAGGSTVGVNWNDVASSTLGANTFDTTVGQSLAGAASGIPGARGTDLSSPADGDIADPGDLSDPRAFFDFNKQLKQYNLKRAVIESPRISLEDLRFAAHRNEQLRAIMDQMTNATRFTWENRYRDEFDRVAKNIVLCLASNSQYLTANASDAASNASASFDTIQTEQFDVKAGFVAPAGDEDYTPSANISNAVLDKAYFQLVRKGAGNNAYGRENGRPVFGLVLSSEASYQLQTEAGFRDDVRYNNSAVSDLIAPLGVEKSFRGFYHLIDDMAPRFNIDSNGVLDRQQPYTSAGDLNSSYEAALYEAAYIIHPDVCESQIPNPLSGANGITFDPLTYRGEFKWTNIADAITNPDSDRGFFRGVMASATKPIKTDFGYVILFKRTSNTPAAV